MNSISMFALFAAVVVLLVLVSVRAVRYLVGVIRARLPVRTKKPPTLMRVGQVTAKPPELPRSQVSLKDVTAADVSTPVRAPHHAPRSATTMFNVDQLRDRSLTIDPKDIVDPADTPLADGSDYAFGPALTPFLAAALPDSAGRKQELKTDLIRAGYYQPHAFENIQAIRWMFLLAPLFLLCVMVNVLPARLEM